MPIRRNSVIKLCLGIVFGAVLYAEVIVYYLQARHWQDLQCQVGDSSCTKILFIADPQITGELDAPPLLSYLFNWDCDRYLRQTFARVFRHFQPEVLVYVGDLMDEGSRATVEQYHNYVQRLAAIFIDVPYPVLQIWLPGDNDIGGEDEPISWDKVKMFQSVFHQPPVVVVRSVSFYKINAITHTLPKLPPNMTDDNFKIAVSHYPLLTRHAFNEQILQSFRPDIYFCGHDHDSKYTTQTHMFERNRLHPFYGNQVLNISFGADADVYEIYVPTCSYRMGTRRIGYGAAVLDNNNTRLRYTVFWSSERYPYLFGYLAILVLFLLYIAACMVKVCCGYYLSRRRRQPLNSKA